MKNWFVQKIGIPALKVGLAAALIYWLIHTKKITAAPFIRLWGTPWLLFYVFATVFAMIVINNYRWLLLLQGQKIESSVKQTLPLTFIGLFFTLAMPGAVGGDVLRAYYIAQDQPGTKLRAATSVLMDRVVGLYAMALTALLALITNLDRITASPHLRPLALFVAVLAVGLTVFFILGFSESVRAHGLTEKFLKTVPGGGLIERIYDAVHDYRHGKKQFVWGVLLSMIVQALSILCFFIISISLHYENVTMGALYFIVPLGLIAMAVPLSPGGVGVGQYAFLALFSWYGLPENLGPTLITIFQVVQAIIGLIGVPFYFMRKAPKKEAVESAVQRDGQNVSW